jgi:hypothetical protein
MPLMAARSRLVERVGMLDFNVLELLRLAVGLQTRRYRFFPTKTALWPRWPTGYADLNVAQQALVAAPRSRRQTGGLGDEARARDSLSAGPRSCVRRAGSHRGQ